MSGNWIKNLIWHSSVTFDARTRNRSILTGAAFVEVSSIEALRQELELPPRNATTRDLRRVGFALGEWGGIKQVDALGLRTSSGDPALQGALLGALAARTH